MATNPYASAEPMFATRPVHITSDEDADRVRAYDVYENIYWNVPETFRLVQRGEEQNPIYLPSARKMIEATNRFLAVDWDFVIDPRMGSAGQQAATQQMLLNLFKRELIYAKFATQKRYGLIKGDHMWHITADPAKPQGTRISIHELDPGHYFPIYDENNSDRIVGCHLVDLITDPRDANKNVVRRQTYRKQDNGTITSEMGAFELDAWDDRDPDVDIARVPWQGRVDEFTLQGITTIPVYHVKNSRIANHGFGFSEVRGIETVLAAVNQTITDEELALVMAGLGVYATDAPPPRDVDDQEVEYEIGPGRVLEVGQGEKFWRVSGVSSVTPSIEHMKFMLGESMQGVGIPEVAAGRVDVAVAESGISLKLQLSPLLAKNSEKEMEMLGVYDHMLYDITHQWLPNYEQFQDSMACSAASVVGDPLPKNRQEIITEIQQLLDYGLITIEMAQSRLAEIGYEFNDGDADLALTQAQRLAAARAFDPFSNRFASELDTITTNGGAPASTGAS